MWYPERHEMISKAQIKDFEISSGIEVLGEEKYQICSSLNQTRVNYIIII